MAGDAKPGVEFTIYGGSINGTFISLTPYTKISQFWRLKSWPAGYFSEVVMKITQTKDNTKLHLTQKGVPTKELEPTKMGWQRYYFHAIKQTYLPYLRNNETKIAKLVKWFNILNEKFNLMKGNLRFGQLTDNQVREMREYCEEDM